MAEKKSRVNTSIAIGQADWNAFVGQVKLRGLKIYEVMEDLIRQWIADGDAPCPHCGHKRSESVEEVALERAREGRFVEVSNPAEKAALEACLVAIREHRAGRQAFPDASPAVKAFKRAK